MPNGWTVQVTLDNKQAGDTLTSCIVVCDRYWQERGVLPDSLPQLSDIPQGPYRLAALDPVTREPYGYRMLDSMSYELCATFDAPSEKPDPAETRALRSRFHEHGSGRVCFPVRVSAPPRRR